MREILFRGKSVDDGKWIFGHLFDDGTVNSKRMFVGQIVVADYNGTAHDKWEIATDFCEVIPETVGQYTGLIDRNGKEIFEGDILDHHVQSDILVNRGVVNWDSINVRWALQLNTMNPGSFLYKPEAFEVIGNIHDNPELLRKAGADMSELKPCPLCGVPPTLAYCCGEYMVYGEHDDCPYCGVAFTEMHSSEELEIEAWNRRVEQ